MAMQHWGDQAMVGVLLLVALGFVMVALIGRSPRQPFARMSAREH
ncbi:hypothetical protein [Silvimonas amylolytica]|nr:hypothetical protein [Silvimonas amylolytica]